MLYASSQFGALDPKLAFHCLSVSAKNGNEKAIVYLIKAYETGYGVEANSKQALYWKKKISREPKDINIEDV